MGILAKSILAAMVCLVMAGVASAEIPGQPFVKVTMPKETVDLGTVWGPGVKRLGARLQTHVLANCAFHLSASFRGFRHEQGKAVVSAQDMQVAINGKEVPSGTARVSIGSSSKPTPADGIDVPVDLQVGVKGCEYYPAGRYNGVLVITVTAGP